MNPGMMHRSKPTKVASVLRSTAKIPAPKFGKEKRSLHSKGRPDATLSEMFAITMGANSPTTKEMTLPKGIPVLKPYSWSPTVKWASNPALEEINQLNRETFTTAGGGTFHYIPWGNDSDGAIATLAEQARNVLAGWI